MGIVEGERFVIIVDFRQIRVGENLGKKPPFSAHPRLQATALLGPSAVPPFLVFPILGITDARLGLDIIEPSIFHAFTAGPDVFAGHRTGVTADTFIKVQDLADLCANLHAICSPANAPSGNSSSNQSTLDNLRTMTNSSRFDPTVP